MTDVRFVINGSGREKENLGMHIRLVATGPPINTKQGRKSLQGTDPPALLVSYVYLEPFLRFKDDLVFRDWALDSGAYSAYKIGTEIPLQDYINKCKELKAKDPKLTDIFALDVIGDWKASLKNTDEMWKQGIEAIPCYHAGEPESVLVGLAKDYPKIAIGGAAGRLRGKQRTQFMDQCFARIWPCRIHGFGVGSKNWIMRYPFHSVDATNWEMKATAYGKWQSFGNQQLSVRKWDNLKSEVDYHLRMERDAKSRWKKEMALLDSLPTERSDETFSGSGEDGSESDIL